MSHLPAERLAALADHEPSPAEAQHLALCGACRREREAYRQLLAMAARERDQDAEPLLGWDALAGRLRAERLLVDAETVDTATTAPPIAPVARRPSGLPGWWRAAAAVLLVSGGIAAGRMSAVAGPFAATVASGTEAPVEDGQFRLAADSDSSPEFASTAEARQALARAERVYQAASAYLARSESSPAADPDPDTYRARLAALDEVAEATREALREAPHDPVINRYYLTTLGARQATLQQLGGALASTQGYRLTRF